MAAPASTFARFTDAHELFIQDLPPCAKSLYSWLLRRAPAGNTAEIHLEEFQNHKQGAFSGRGYTLYWIKKSLQQLIDLGAVEVAFKYSSKVFKLITWHPDRQSAEDLKRSSPVLNKTSENFNKSFNFAPSNAHSFVPLYRELKEITDRTIKKAVSQEGQEGPQVDRPAPPILRSQKTPLEALLDTPVSPPTPQIQPIEVQEDPEQATKQVQEIEDPIAPEISEKIKIAGFKLNSTLARIVRSAQAQIVLDAIEAAQQYVTKAKRENQALKRDPEAILVSAIKGQWQPNKSDKLSEVIPLPDNFEAWYEVARRANIARASSSQADVTRHPQGVLCIEANGRWSTFDEISRCFPIPELEEMAKKREEAISSPSAPPDHLKAKLAGLFKHITMT